MKFIDSFFFGASPLGVEGFPLGSRLRSDMGGRGGREVSRLAKESDADAEKFVTRSEIQRGRSN